MEMLWPASRQLPPDHVLSLKSPQAKVWMEQDRRVTGAIKGETLGPPVVEIAYRPWLEELGAVTITPRGPRWLARGGVLAPLPTRSVIALKGAWVLNGQTWTDPSKAARSEQLHRFGFS